MQHIVKVSYTLRRDIIMWNIMYVNAIYIFESLNDNLADYLFTIMFGTSGFLWYLKG